MGNEALARKIRKAAESNETKFILVNTQLTSLPPEIGELTNLKMLLLSNNQLTSLPPEIGELTNLKMLFLSNNQLTSLPPEIGQLTNLEELNLSFNGLTLLPPEIGQLTKLKNLLLDGNKLTSLPSAIGQLGNLVSLSAGACPLSSLPSEIGKLSSLKSLVLMESQLTSLPPQIGQLTSLTKLHLASNQLTTVPPEISRLTRLEVLALALNQLTSLPPESGQLASLTTLDLGSNRLTSLPPEICKLTSLTTLQLRRTQLTSLPPEIGQLTSLTTLDLSANHLKSLPPEIGRLTSLTTLELGVNELTGLPPEIDHLTSLATLDLNGNQLGIPPEILKKSPKEILNYYFRITRAETRPLNEAKVLVVGEAAVGKTSLINRLLDMPFNRNEQMTEGVERHKWQLGDVRLNVWDFGGQEIMHATHQFFLTKRSVYLLVIDSRENEQQSRINYWMRIIQSFGGDSPVILVCNKCDQQKADLNWSKLKSDYENLQIVEEVSCEDPAKGIDEITDLISDNLRTLDHVRDVLPKSWFEVKDELEKLEEQGQSHIEYAKYERTCRDASINDEGEREALITLLHDLGIVLHFHDHPILKDENILNPEWVTRGVYYIVTRDKLKGVGVIGLEELHESLPKEHYSTAMQRLFIVEVMKKFELCYEFDQQFLIPGLLTKDRPEIGDWKKSLRIEYRYAVLPESVISRFIVRTFDQRDRQMWRTGVVLESVDGGNSAVVEADLESAKIEIAVAGDNDGRRRLLEDVRSTLRRIQASLPGIGAEEFVPLPGQPHVAISYERLLSLKKRGRKDDFIKVGQVEYDFNVDELLDGVTPPLSSRVKALVDLLCDLFPDVSQILQFVAFQPRHERLAAQVSDSAPLTQVALEVLQAYEKHGLLDKGFFDRLETERTGRVEDIRRVRGMWCADT